jgi:hypothetical protein
MHLVPARQESALDAERPFIPDRRPSRGAGGGFDRLPAVIAQPR